VSLALLLAAAGGLFLGWALGRRAAAVQRTRAEALQARLGELEGAPEVWEGRIEHFDVLWFPVVTADRRTRKVVSVKAGVPHCPKCAVPLTLVRDEWACADCGAKRRRVPGRPDGGRLHRQAGAGAVPAAPPRLPGRERDGFVGPAQSRDRVLDRPLDPARVELVGVDGLGRTQRPRSRFPRQASRSS